MGNRERLEEMFRAWNERRPGDTVEHFDEHVVWDTRELRVIGTTDVYHGVERMMEYWASWLPQWSEIQVDLEWIEAPGDRVVAWVFQRMIGRESGIEVATHYGWDTSWRDGKLIRVSFFTDEAEARRAAGLD